MDYEAVIGLEVHCQLATDSKCFCGSRARPEAGGSVADEEPNAHTCEICAGHPGTLPALNAKAVEYAVRAGLATGCTIRTRSVFARKNYFYPDLPKGYQISQLDLPLCENGALEIETPQGPKSIRIQRIHMEEDAGKNVHHSSCSVVNLNRAGVPLVEIVTEPDFRTPQEAGDYLRQLYGIVTAIGICDGNLQEGNFRCDANVSIRPKGATALGTRTEIKNVNSFRFVEKAIEVEIARQIQVVESGQKVVQETRGYDSGKNRTFTQRSKEEAHDYRYFPDPDLPALELEAGWIEQVRQSLPELPLQKRARWIQEFGLSAMDASTLTLDPSIMRAFESAVALAGDRKLPSGQATSAQTTAAQLAKSIAHLLTGEAVRLVSATEQDFSESKVTAAHLVDLAAAQKSGELSSTAAKKVLSEVWTSGEAVEQVVSRLGLKQVNDTAALEKVVSESIANHPLQAAEFRSGKEKVLGFLVGQAMKASGGKANPGVMQEILRKKLKE